MYFINLKGFLFIKIVEKRKHMFARSSMISSITI